MAAVLRRPKLHFRIRQFLFRYPALNQQLVDVARRQGYVPSVPHDATIEPVAQHAFAYHDASWSTGTPSLEGLAMTRKLSDRDSLTAIRDVDGINYRQRTPLEAYVHNFLNRE